MLLIVNFYLIECGLSPTYFKLELRQLDLTYAITNSTQLGLIYTRTNLVHPGP